MATRRRQSSQPLTDALKREIRASNKNYLQLERETGVLRQSLMKFMHGETSLRLDIADKLAVYFELELRAAKKRRAK
jgi:transcriptional regulator with XRE-family HTH domain